MTQIPIVKPQNYGFQYLRIFIIATVKDSWLLALYSINAFTWEVKC
jgi:hypothetical protein